MSSDIQRMVAVTKKAIEALQEEVFSSPPSDWADFKLRQGQWVALQDIKQQALLILKTNEEL